MENYIKNLADAINKSDKSIAEISRKSKITRASIYHILNNKVTSVTPETINALCNALGYDIAYIMKPTEKKLGKRIPVLGAIPAGIPIEAVEEILDYEEITEDMAKTGEFFALKVKGDSMAPTINDGDIVIVKKQDDADSGKVCVVMVNGDDATLKRIKKEPNGLWLNPDNSYSEFKPTFYTNSEVENKPVRILGVIVELRRTF